MNQEWSAVVVDSFLQRMGLDLVDFIEESLRKQGDFLTDLVKFCENIFRSFSVNFAVSVEINLVPLDP